MRACLFLLTVTMLAALACGGNAAPPPSPSPPASTTVTAAPTGTPVASNASAGPASPAAGASAGRVPSSGAAPPGEVKYEFGPGLPADQQDVIRDSVQRTQRFLLQNMGVTAGGITVYAYNTLDETFEAYIRLANVTDPAYYGVLREALQHSPDYPGGKRFMIISTVAESWQRGLSRDIITTHAYVNVLQNQLSGLQAGAGGCDIDKVCPGGPWWIHDGARILISERVRAERDGVTIESMLSSRLVPPSRAASAPLSSMETNQGYSAVARQGGSNIAGVAVHFLTLDRGLGSLVQYWEALGRGVTWQTAFATAFGESPEQYYGEFEQRRRTGFPPTSGPAARPPAQPALVTILTVTSPVRRGEQVGAVTHSTAGAECTLAFIGPGGTRILDRGSACDPKGDAWWVWTASADLPPGTYGIEVSCGGGPVAIAEIIVQ